jgi:hypothetical protein
MFEEDPQSQRENKLIESFLNSWYSNYEQNKKSIYPIKFGGDCFVAIIRTCMWIQTDNTNEKK